MQLDDNAREEALASPRGRNAARLTNAQNELLSEPARLQAERDLGGLEGQTVQEARAHAKKKRDAKRGSDYKKASGIRDSDIGLAVQSRHGPSEEDEDDDFASYLSAQRASRSGQPTGSERPNR
jgi:broad specificity phosphatase PhoE